jgi:serralysin
MTGTSYSYFGDSGVLEIDALVGHTRWTANPSADIVTYSFPTSASQYGNASVYEEVAQDDHLSTFAPINDVQKTMAISILEQSYGNSANDGFTVEGFTNLQLQQTTSHNTANLRYANSAIPSDYHHSAVAFLPFNEVCTGDIWFDDNDATSPKSGNFGGYTFLHETGHVLGLNTSAGSSSRRSSVVSFRLVLNNPTLPENTDGYETQLHTRWDTIASRAARVTNVRLPECDEHPANSAIRHAAVNQLTIDLGVIA